MELASLIVTSLTLLVTIGWLGNAFRSLKKTVEQYDDRLKNDFFAEYTRRYQDIKLHLPIGFFEENDSDIELKDEALRYARALFDLFSEEYYLWKSSKLEKEVWDEWEEEMLQTLALPAVKDAWDRLVEGSKQYTEFNRFVSEKRDLLEIQYS